MNYEQIRRTVATKRSMKQIETSLHSKLNNVRIDEISDEQVMGRSGSKLLYRLFGAYVWPGSRNFPMRFTISHDEGDDSRRIVAIDTDMGPYLVSLPRAKELYQETADTLIAAVAQ